MRLSYTHKFTIGFSRKELDEYCKTLVSVSEQNKAVREELYQCACGIEDGDFQVDDWRIVFFKHLEESGIIEMTEKGKRLFQ